MAHEGPGDPGEEPSGLGKLFYFMQDDKGKMGLSLTLAVIGEVAGMVPYLVVAALAASVYDGTITLVWAALLAAIAAGAHIARFFFTWQSSIISHGLAFYALKRIRQAVARKMERVPMGVIVETPTGTFKNYFVDNVNTLEDSIAHFMPELPSNVAGPAAALTLMFALDWRMGLASLATIPIGLLFFAGMMRGYQSKMATYLGAENKMNSALVEYVNGIQVIKAFNRTASSFGTFSEAVHFFHDSTLAWYRQSWVWMAGIRAVMPSTLLVTLPLGAWLFATGSLSLPVFLACIIIPLGFIAPIMKFSQAAGQIASIDACLSKIWAFLAIPELKRPAEPATLKTLSFEFDNVDFSYTQGKEVLHGISFSTRPSTITALVGPSGSGKSTIAKLMAGFWDATGGEIRFGGVDVRAIPFEQLMDNVAYVAQDTFLFDKSILENIRMGRPGATDDEVRAAATAAGCHDFIMQLDAGYDTRAGEAGDRLSGGERQRITIARAMLKDAPIVILDEATAYADPENEALVEQAISRLVTGKTLVVVAHRLSTIRHADQILVVANGSIECRGTQQELLDTCPLYRRMWDEHMLGSDRVLEGVR